MDRETREKLVAAYKEAAGAGLGQVELLHRERCARLAEPPRERRVCHRLAEHLGDSLRAVLARPAAGEEDASAGRQTLL